MSIHDFHDRFSPEACGIMALAQKYATELGFPFVATEHLLLAILGQEGTRGSDELRSVGVSIEGVYAQLVRVFGEAKVKEAGTSPEFQTVEMPTILLGSLTVTCSPTVLAILQLAQRDCTTVQSQHLLSGIIEEELNARNEGGLGRGAAGKILENLGVNLAMVQTRLQSL